MKKVALIKTEHTIQEKEFPLDYREQYISLITGSTDGFSYAQMRKVDKVFDKLEAAKGKDFVLLEDAEHEVLKGKLENPQFSVFTKELFAMCTSGIEAPEHLETIKAPKEGNK